MLFAGGGGCSKGVVRGHHVTRPALLVGLQMENAIRTACHKSHGTRHTSLLTHDTLNTSHHASDVTRDTRLTALHLKHWKVNHPKYMPTPLVKVESLRAAALPLLQRVLEHGTSQLA